MILQGLSLLFIIMVLTFISSFGLLGIGWIVSLVTPLGLFNSTIIAGVGLISTIFAVAFGVLISTAQVPVIHLKK